MEVHQLLPIFFDRVTVDPHGVSLAIGGIVLGLLVTAAGALFAVRKREAEVRLLRSDGDAGWRFAARAIAQFVAPAAVVLVFLHATGLIKL